MGYIERTLVESERLLRLGHLHWIIFARAVLFAVAGVAVMLAGGAQVANNPNGAGSLIGIGFLLILASAYLGIRALVRRWTTEIAATTRRFVVKRGFVRRLVMEIGAGQIESIAIHQSVLGRLLDFGTVVVEGTGSGIDPVGPVAEPLKLRRALDRLYRPR